MPGAPGDDEGLFVLTGRKLDSDSATTSERERHRHHLSIISLARSIHFPIVGSAIRRQSDTLFDFHPEEPTTFPSCRPKRLIRKAARRQAAPNKIWARFLLDLLPLSPPSIFFLFFVRLKSEGTIDRLSAFCDIAIGACCESEAGIRRRRRRL